MNASKVIITAETRSKLNNPVLSWAKRRELREKLIIDFIRERPGGVATKQELIYAAGLDGKTDSKDYANGLGLIESMIKRKVISHYPTTSYTKNWFVQADVKTRKLERQPIHTLPAPGTPEKKEETKAEYSLTIEPAKELDKESLLDMAKQWAWENNSDSLRDFIAFAQKRVK